MSGRRPGDLALHPVIIGAIATLVINDHMLKLRHLGWFTGILSDVAGLLFLPVLLVVALELATNRALSPRAYWVAAIVVMASFAIIEMTEPGTNLYEGTLGHLQWFARGSWRDTPGTVQTVRDPFDLVALPAAVVGPVLLHRCAARSVRQQSVS